MLAFSIAGCVKILGLLGGVILCIVISWLAICWLETRVYSWLLRGHVLRHALHKGGWGSTSWRHIHCGLVKMYWSYSWTWMRIVNRGNLLMFVVSKRILNTFPVDIVHEILHRFLRRLIVNVSFLS